MPEKGLLNERAARAATPCPVCGEPIGRGNRATCAKTACRLAHRQQVAIARVARNAELARAADALRRS